MKQNGHFPILARLETTGEVNVYADPLDIPSGVGFTVLETNYGASQTKDSQYRSLDEPWLMNLQNNKIHHELVARQRLYKNQLMTDLLTSDVPYLCYHPKLNQYLIVYWLTWFEIKNNDGYKETLEPIKGKWTGGGWYGLPSDNGKRPQNQRCPFKNWHDYPEIMYELPGVDYDLPINYSGYHTEKHEVVMNLLELADRWERAAHGDDDAAIGQSQLDLLGIKKLPKKFKSKKWGIIDTGEWNGMCACVYEKLTGEPHPGSTARGTGFRSQAYGRAVAEAIRKKAIND